MKIQIKKTRHAAIIPQYMTPGAAGMDLHACLEREIFVVPGARLVVPTAFSRTLEAGAALPKAPRRKRGFIPSLSLNP